MFSNSYINIEPKRIAFLKFIIEGYDGLATVTTIDRNKGIVRLTCPAARNAELTLLIQELLPSAQQTSCMQ